MQTDPSVQLSRPKLALVGTIRLFVLLGCIAGLLFWAAGTMAWTRGWLFIAMLGLTFAGNLVFLISKNPQLMQARWQQKSDTKPFDKIFGLLYLIATISMMVLAGLDAVRFQWTSMAPALLFAGLAMHALGLVPVLWSLQISPHSETTVRIQSDRNHRVITDGPYRYVRHPMYVGVMVMFWGWAFVLQSWMAFAAASALAMLLVIRTALEDRTLQNELPGYVEFCTATRYRLVPGVW